MNATTFADHDLFLAQTTRFLPVCFIVLVTYEYMIKAICTPICENLLAAAAALVVPPGPGRYMWTWPGSLVCKSRCATDGYRL